MLDGDRIIIDDTIGGNLDSTWIIAFCSNYTIPLALYDTFHNRAVANDTYNMVDRNYIQGTHSLGKGNEPVTWEIVSGTETLTIIYLIFYRLMVKHTCIQDRIAIGKP